VARVRFTIHARGRGRVVRRNSGGGDRFLVPGRWEGGSGAEMAQKDTGGGGIVFSFRDVLIMSEWIWSGVGGGCAKERTIMVVTMLGVRRGRENG